MKRVVGLLLFALVACDDATTTTPDADKVTVKASIACGRTSLPKGVLIGQHLVIKDVERAYDLIVPDTYDGTKPLPVTFVFHDQGSSSAAMRAAYAIEPVAAGKSIVVYPNATREWDLQTRADSNGDMLFFDAILDGLAQSHCIDTNRVFAAGYAAGGRFVNELACRRGSRLRAIASHAGGGPNGDRFDAAGNLLCAEKPVGALITHGAADVVVPLAEGQRTKNHWSRVNGCRSTGGDPRTPAPCLALVSCARDRPVVYCEIPGHDHRLWDQSAAAAWPFFESF